MLKYLWVKGSSPAPRPNASPRDTFWRGLAGRASEYNVSALMSCVIELENTKLILNKRTRKMRLLVE